METSGAFSFNEALLDQSSLTKPIWALSSAGPSGIFSTIQPEVSRGAFTSESDLLSTSNFTLNQPLEATIRRVASANISDSHSLFPQPASFGSLDALDDVGIEVPEPDEFEEEGGIRLRDPLTGLAEPEVGTEIDGEVFLDFSSTNSGLEDQNGRGIGFTSVQTNEDDSQADLYAPGRVELDTTTGTLSLTAEQGSDASTNTLENALQLPIAATQPFTISTRLIDLQNDPTGGVQQGGIFLGLSQDDYVKLAVVGSDDADGGVGLQFFKEKDGQGTNIGGPQILNLPSSDINTLDLFLTGDPGTGVIKAAYRVNSNTVAPISLPEEFQPGSIETFFADKSTAHAGILPDTQTASDTPVAYDRFSIQYAAAEAGVDVKVNFQPDNAPVPNGYIKDIGESYQAQGTGTFGWVRQDSLNLSSAQHVPLDITPNTRDRNRSGIEQRLDTIIHMQGNNVPNFTGVKIPAAWEYALPAGQYSVSVSVGDLPNSNNVYDSTHKISIEGQTAIPSFTPQSSTPQSGAIHEYELGTTQVDVSDGRLTISALGGNNTKLNYLRIESVTPGDHPSISGGSPTSRQTGISLDAAVNLDVNLVTTGAGVDATTLTTENVRLYRTRDNQLVSGTLNTTGGGDAIVYQPNSPLQASTHYTLRVSDGVRDQAGNSFLPFSTSFSTGTAGIPQTPGVNFNKSTVYDGSSISSLVINGNKLYAASLDGNLRRWTIGSSGNLSNLKTFTGLAGRAIVGITFDPTNPNVLWVSHNDTVFVQPANDFTGKISKLTLQSGPAFNASIKDYVTGLPRSAKDHLSNSLVFGPDDKLYLTQGSNSAMGAPDDAWYQRPERLLTAAVLQIDPRRNPAQPFNVKTEGRGAANYNPFAANAPVKLFATGTRNAYDLVWTDSGSLYVPTNGSAAGGSTPNNPNTPANEGLTNVATQNDYLFNVVQGGYYGHPNPKRNEYIMNGGNPTNGVDPAEVVDQASYNGYNVGTQPDPDYQGFAYDFGRNRSPNGIIEYQSNTFGGALQNKLLVVEYSGGDDILALQPDNNGNIPAAGVTQTASGFVNPLDLIEDTRNGNLYVAQLVDEVTGQGRITLLKPA